MRRREDMRLKKRVAIVTGAARGIDQAHYFALAREGARVVAADILQIIKRVEEPTDLAGTVVFLASEDSDFITG
jgi:NAD(P)-dependent dehydrogenase (short-subunit alcohol dehydrogenase family)